MRYINSRFTYLLTCSSQLLYSWHSFLCRVLRNLAADSEITYCRRSEIVSIRSPMPPIAWPWGRPSIVSMPRSISFHYNSVGQYRCSAHPVVRPSRALRVAACASLCPDTTNFEVNSEIMGCQLRAPWRTQTAPHHQ